MANDPLSAMLDASEEAPFDLNAVDEMLNGMFQQITEDKLADAFSNVDPETIDMATALAVFPQVLNHSKLPTTVRKNLQKKYAVGNYSDDPKFREEMIAVLKLILSQTSDTPVADGQSADSGKSGEPMMPNMESMDLESVVVSDIKTPASIFDGAEISDSDLLKEAEQQEEEAKQVPVEVQDQDLSDEAAAGTVPAFIKQMHEDYRSNVAHCFLIHGNVNDYPDNNGNRGDLRMLFSQVFDSFWLEKRIAERNKQIQDPTKKIGLPKPLRPRVFCYYTVNAGLTFPDTDSWQTWEDLMKESYSGKMDADQLEMLLHPQDLPGVLQTLDRWFEASKQRMVENRMALEQQKGKKVYSSKPKQELLLTFALFDADLFLPNAPVSQLSNERFSIGYIRNWARDKDLGNRNRILLISRHLEDIQETLRAGDSGISSVLIKHPSLEERQQWLQAYAQQIKVRPPKVANKPMTAIQFASDFDMKSFAIMSAGMPRRQLENTIMLSWVHNQPLDEILVKEQKQRSIETEFGGLVDFVEPEFGFEQIGGHEHLKKYFHRKIIVPLKANDRRTCSKGVILTGPPGTGKTKLALALAKEARINFMEAHLDRVFGGIVGETESKMRQLLEAIDSAAPAIVFLDEIDSVLSSGRESPGDSGTSARVFNNLMTFLSDDSRAGRIVVIAACNRPDLLDAALIRAGRFDAILPALPPAAGNAAGRMEILKALLAKFKVKFAKDLQPTIKEKDSGVGLLLYDSRLWTGAEIEAIMKESIDNAVFEAQEAQKDVSDNKLLISRENWEQAMRDIIPGTGEVEFQIDLALYYVNHLGYCPEEWKDRARNKKELKQATVAARMHNDDYVYDRE